MMFQNASKYIYISHGSMTGTNNQAFSIMESKENQNMPKDESLKATF